MTHSFNLKTPPKIVFGAGKFSELQHILYNYGAQPLFVIGGQSFIHTQQFDQLHTKVAPTTSRPHIVHIDQEPSPELIDSVVKKYQDMELGIVVGIGGGSVLDAAKAISAMLAEQADVIDFLEGVGTRQPSGKKLPFIAIPTTSGTGSEATSNAVISQVGANGFKKSLRHDNYVPDIAIIDPELTLSCPRTLTVACAMDCFSQLVEGYLSTNSSSVTDILAIDGIKAIQRSLKIVGQEQNNIKARSDLSYAALLSGIVLANAGLGTIHGFASVIGGLFPIPHGVVCGTLMATANDYTLQSLRQNEENNQKSLQKYTTLGKLFSEEKHKSEHWYQDHFIHELHLFNDTLKIPKLSHYGLTESDIDNIADTTGNKYNPIALNKNERGAILRARLD